MILDVRNRNKCTVTEVYQGLPILSSICRSNGHFQPVRLQLQRSSGLSIPLF